MTASWSLFRTDSGAARPFAVRGGDWRVAECPPVLRRQARLASAPRSRSGAEEQRGEESARLALANAPRPGVESSTKGAAKDAEIT